LADPAASAVSTALVGSGASSCCPCETSCCCLVKSAVRVQPGTAHGISLSSRVSSKDWHAVHSCLGGGRSPANASSCAAADQVHVPVQPVRSHRRSASWSLRDFSRQGSHMPSVAGSPSDAACPSPKVLLESWSHVRVHPGTRHGKDLAPNLSASVNFPAAIGSFVSWQQRLAKASSNSVVLP